MTDSSTMGIKTVLAEVTAAGATLKQAPNDVGGGRLVASFTDPDGNVLGLIPGPLRQGQGPETRCPRPRGMTRPRTRCMVLAATT